MAKYKNIEEYRAKNKRKNLFKRLLFFIFIIAVLITLLNVLQLFKGKNIDDIISKNPSNTTEMFPIVIKNEQLLDLYNIGSDFSLLSKSNLSIYDDSGKRTNSLAHGYTNPVVREGNKRLLAYDRGGYRFRVDSSSKSIGEKSLANPIMYAQISNDGHVAVVTNHNRYASQITVYDNNLNEIYQYSSAKNITAVCFSPNQNYILATTITVIDSAISAQLFELNIGDENDINTYTVKNILPLDVGYCDNNNITLIGKDKLVSYNTKTNQDTAYDYKGEILTFINSSSKESVIATRNLLDSTITIEVISSNGTIGASYDINDEVIDLYSDGSRIIVLGKNHAYNFDMALLLLNEFKLDKNFSKIVYNGNKLYIMSVDSVEYYKIS